MKKVQSVKVGLNERTDILWQPEWANQYQDPVTKVNYQYYPSSGTAIVRPGGISYSWRTDVVPSPITTHFGSGSSVEGDIEILSQFTVKGKTYRVTGIGRQAFCGNGSITSVKIPSTVTSIEEMAFFSCAELTSVNIAEGVVSIGVDAFAQCTALSSVNIPASVKAIGEWAFFNDTSLGSVLIPQGVTLIKEGAFCDCTSLSSVYIPKSVKTIGDMAFSGCTALSSVNITVGSSGSIPVGVTTIGDEAFCGCTALTSFEMPQSVNKIGDYAFYGCSDLSTITGLANVDYVGYCAFDYTDWYDKLYVDNDGAIYIGKTLYMLYYLFSDTYKVREGTKAIAKEAFAYAIPYYEEDEELALTSVIIPEGVDYIGPSAFGNCRSLANVSIPSTLKYVAGGAFNGTQWFNGLPNGPVYLGKVLYAYKGEPANVTIPEGVVSISEGVFKGSSLTSIKLPSSINKIEAGTFRDCNALASISFPEGLTQIGDSAFWGCNALTSISIPDGVTRINDYTFAWCQNLKSITIPSSVDSIGIGAFSSCSSLSEVHISDMRAWAEMEFEGRYESRSYYSSANPLCTAKHLYLNGAKVEGRLNIPQGTTHIAEYAFYGFNDITSLYIPSSVGVIGEHAFERCENLKSVTLSEGVATIRRSVFLDCSSLESIHIPSSVSCIGSGAFYNENLSTADVDVADIGAWCNVELENSNSSPFYYTKQFCVNGKVITDLVIPDGVTEIGDYVFCGCENITSVAIPNSVTSIREWAFSGCKGLTSLTIGNGVESVGKSAFSGCNGLQSVNFGKGVKSVGIDAFSGCSSLNSVHISDLAAWCEIDFPTDYRASDYWGTYYYDSKSNPLIYAHHLFLNDVEIKDLVIPDEVTAIGSGAFYGCTSFKSVTIPSSVTSIGKCAFYQCSGLEEVRSMIKEPFGIRREVFLTNGTFSMMGDYHGNFTTATLYVPTDTRELYRQCEGWKEFTAIIETDFADERPKGDMNGDEIVNGSDMVALVNVIMNGGSNPSADVNGDGIVNGSDMVALVNIIMNGNKSRELMAARSESVSPANSGVTIGTEPLRTNTDGSRELTITLSNPQMDVTMVQMDMTLPEGLTLNIDGTDMMAGRTTRQTHHLYAATSNDGRDVRLMLASGSNALIEGTEGGIIRLMLKADGAFHGGDIVLHDMLCTSPDLKEARPVDTIVRIDSTTGITDNKREAINNNGSAYDLQGRHIDPSIKRKGVIIINGKKFIK